MAESCVTISWFNIYAYKNFSLIWNNAMLTTQLILLFLMVRTWRCGFWNRCSTSRRKRPISVVPYCKPSEVSSSSNHLMAFPFVWVSKLMDNKNGDCYMLIWFINCLVWDIYVEFSFSFFPLWIKDRSETAYIWMTEWSILI